MRIEILGETEVPHGPRIVARTLERTEHHHRNRLAERIVLDPLQERRDVLSVRQIAAPHADGRQIGPQLLQPLRIGTVMETGEDLDSARPQFLGHGLVRGHHALLHHLVGFVIRTLRETGHAPLVVQQDLGLRNFQIKRARREASAAQLLRQRSDLTDHFRLWRLAAPANQDAHHLLVGVTGLRADDGLCEPACNALSVLVEGEEGREGQPVLAGHERTDAVGKLLREHRHHTVQEIDARRTLERFAVERRARPHIMGDVGDVYA